MMVHTLVPASLKVMVPEDVTEQNEGVEVVKVTPRPRLLEAETDPVSPTRRGVVGVPIETE